MDSNARLTSVVKWKFEKAKSMGNNKMKILIDFNYKDFMN